MRNSPQGGCGRLVQSSYLQMYHQLQAWRANDIYPKVWGWKKSITGLLRIRMSQPAAPTCLISIIRCKCSGKCNKKTCTCFKNGLLCTPACGQCRGITCLNGPAPYNQDDDDLEDTTGV